MVTYIVDHTPSVVDMSIADDVCLLYGEMLGLFSLHYCINMNLILCNITVKYQLFGINTWLAFITTLLTRVILKDLKVLDNIHVNSCSKLFHIKVLESKMYFL